MKKKWIPLIILCSSAVFVLGLWLGHILEFERQGDSQAARNNAQTTIAVVNSDVGVEVDGVRQNFAEAIISTLGDDFVLVSPAMAHRGYTEGSYGAMITFPSQVSEQVLSFNANEPERVQLDFVINPNLSEQDYLNTYKQIVDLQQSINTMLSYTYISSLFGQIHMAQDEIEHVFMNDLATIGALDIIYFRNFTTGLELAEIPDIPFNPNDLDTSEYLLTVTDMAENISGMYHGSYDEAIIAYEVMRSKVIALTDNFQTQQDDWLADLNAWTGVTQGFGTDLEAFATGFSGEVDDWLDEWEKWYDELVAYEENVEDYSDHVYAWYDKVMVWRGEHVVFNDIVNARVRELNDRL